MAVSQLEKTAQLLKTKLAQVGYKNFQQLVTIRTAFDHINKLVSSSNYDYVYVEDDIFALGKLINNFVSKAYYNGVSASQSKFFLDKCQAFLKKIDLNLKNDTPDSSFFMRLSNLKDQISKFLPTEINMQAPQEPTYEFETDTIVGNVPNI